MLMTTESFVENAKALITSDAAAIAAHYGGISNLKIEVEAVDGFVFGLCHYNIASSKRMHRYGIYLLSHMGISKLYETGNVIDGNRFYDMAYAKHCIKTFFNHNAKLLNKLIP